MIDRLIVIVSLIFCLFTSGCQTTNYYFQAIYGHCRILYNRQNIEKMIQNPETPQRLTKKLKLVQEIRKFAINKLKLPGNDQYVTYVDIEKPYVVWNVFATPKFSLIPKKWCYPIVGCSAYRGYFSKQDAYEYALKLEEEGYEVYIGGVTAYSTLGWFSDSILSTFINRSDADFASLIFHELSHHIFYIKDDTTFNESFATFVEQEGLRLWLNAKNNSDALDNYLIDYKRNQEFVKLVIKYKKQLQKLYAKDLSLKEKRDMKKLIFQKLKQEYKQIKKQWNNFSGYDYWFKDNLNNAKMITVATYNDLVPQFKKLFYSSKGDFRLFYKTCKELSCKTKKQRYLYFKR